MEQTTSQFLAQFVLEQIALQAGEKRIMLYRAFAVETQDAHAQAECRSLASELETIEQQHHALVQYFQKTGKQNPSSN